MIIFVVCIKIYVVTPHMSEQSCREGSDEWSQHMVSMRNKKNYPSIIIKNMYFLLSRALQSVPLLRFFYGKLHL